MFAYHGYPHHYFNASQQGLEQVFAQFTSLRTGIAPYQMPSFGLRSVLETYRRDLGREGEPDVRQLQSLLQQVLDQPLGTFDGRFSEEVALRTTAGTFYFGVKSPQGTSDVVPEALQAAWRRMAQLQQRFPDMFNLGAADNIMLWAKTEGRQQEQEIARYFDSIVPFYKSDTVGDTDLQIFRDLLVIEPRFGNIADTRQDAQDQKHPGPQSPEQQSLAQLQQHIGSLEAMISLKDQHITDLESLIRQLENGRLMRLMRLLSKPRV